MNEVENVISTLSKEQLKEKIMNFAESQPVSDRNSFLQLLKQGFSSEVCSDEIETALEVTPQELIEQIEEYSQRILNGDYFDEDESWRARDREEYRYWGSHYNDYCDDQIDFSKVSAKSCNS